MFGVLERLGSYGGRLRVYSYIFDRCLNAGVNYKLIERYRDYELGEARRTM